MTSAHTSDSSPPEITLAMIREVLSVPLLCDSLDAAGYPHQSPRLPIGPITLPHHFLVGRAKTTLWADMAHVDPEPYKLVGKFDIPAFVDKTADSYDQVIENEQREGLKPLELALFVQRRLAAGDTQAVIARRLGKSRQYVTMATALIDAPDWLISAYREGRCRGLNELYELRKLAGDHPQYVESWTADRDAITRDRVTALRADLADVPVLCADGKVTNVYHKIESEALLKRPDKDIIWRCLTLVREAYLKLETAETDGAHRGYQWNMNWKHTRAELDQVYEASKILKLSSDEMRGR